MPAAEGFRAVAELHLTSHSREGSGFREVREGWGETGSVALNIFLTSLAAAQTSCLKTGPWILTTVLGPI